MATSTSVGTTIFKGLKTPRQLLNFNLMRGVTDFSNLEQWDLYEKGYPFLVVVSVPQFLRDLAGKSDEIRVMLDNYVHVLENDFRGIDNIDNITAETGEITNGIRSIQVINKVTKPSNSSFTCNYFERSGSLMTKMHELYTTGVKDPDTQVKHYHGLIDDWIYDHVDTPSGKDPGFHQEVFTFMYFMTDNTMTKVERAFLIGACQPTSVNYSDLYSGGKGDIQFADLSLSFNGFFMNNDFVYQKAQDMLLAMRNPKNLTASRIIVDSNNFKYQAISKAGFAGGADGNDKFSSPNYFSASEGWATTGDIKTGAVNPFGNAYSTEAKQILTPSGSGTDKNDVSDYNSMLASMSGIEHAVPVTGGSDTSDNRT
jgi:hypothetical protein